MLEGWECPPRECPGGRAALDLGVVEGKEAYGTADLVLPVGFKVLGNPFVHVCGADADVMRALCCWGAFWERE